MSNDAKFGLLAGLMAVVVIAVVYYQRKPGSEGSPAPQRVKAVPLEPKGSSRPAKVTLPPLEVLEAEPALQKQ